MRRRTTRLMAVGSATAVIAVVSLALSGCSAPAQGGGSPDARIRVVASTSVYGDIARQIGGDRVSVTSLIDDPAQDPHSFEASARQQLAIARADVVIENGGGYDDFVDRMLAASSARTAATSATPPARLTATALSDSGSTSPGPTGQTPSPGSNEHVWYDFASMRSLGRALVGVLAERDSANAQSFRSGGERFDAALAELVSAESRLKARFGGAGVLVTEPVPSYLLEASGLTDLTPSGFASAIEQGSDVSPAVMRDTLALLRAGTVALLAYNEQTASPQTVRLEAAARQAGVPVVSFTETIPHGADYVGWMTANLSAISAALAGNPS